MPYRSLLTYTICSLLLAICFNLPPAAANPNPGVPNPADSIFKSWYFTPTGVYGRLPLDKPKNRSYVRISHPTPDLAVIQSINPAGTILNTTRVYFRDGLLHLSTETDRWGNTYDSTWFTPDGPDKFLVTERKKGVNPYLPCKYLQYTFHNDLLTEILCYLDSVRAGANQEGVGHYVFERYDDPGRRGLIKTETYLTDVDMPAFSRIVDCHKLINEYDAKGNLITRSIYDQDDKPILDRFRVFRTKYKYDNDDNQTMVDYYDTKGALTVSAWGYAEKTSDYKHGLLITEIYYLDQSTITRSSRLADSVSIIEHKYDEAGNLTETEYFDPLNNPMVNAEGVHKIRNEYSSTGMLIRTDRIGMNKETGWDSKTYGSHLIDRDDKGRMIAMRTQSNTGLIIPDASDGAVITKYSYDDWGRIHSQSCWRDDSTRMACSLGEYEVTRRYNDDGQVVEVDHLDADGNLSTGTFGYSKEFIRYNEQGLPSERTYFRGDKPVLLNDKLASLSSFHRLHYSYDLLNRLRSVSFFDTAGHPTNAALRFGKTKNWMGEEIDLDYNGALLTGESIRDSGDVNPPVALDCSKGQCVPPTAFETIVRTTQQGSIYGSRQYHGRIRPTTFFDSQLAFAGQDTVLVFLTEGSAYQTGIACADLYRLEPVNKFYQLDGQVTDYFMDNDSVAATYNYDQGKLEGPVYLYYQNGRVRERGTYRNNIKYGVWEHYYDNGQKERTLQYDENGNALVVDCYTRNGDVLARNGNGQFVGKVEMPGGQHSTVEVTAKGKIKDGLPDSEWDLYNGLMTGPEFVETFSAGKFRHGVSNSLAGKATYSDKWFTRLDRPHPYEFMDHYQSVTCRPQGASFYPHSDLYPEIRKGFTDIINSGTYPGYSGWVFLDVSVDVTGHVLGTTVRLYRPNDIFEKAIHDMATRLVYPVPTHNSSLEDTPYEKLYIILVDGSQIVIPEEVLQAQRLGLNQVRHR
jgi:hypothetical protein